MYWVLLDTNYSAFVHTVQLLILYCCYVLSLAVKNSQTTTTTMTSTRPVSTPRPPIPAASSGVSASVPSRNHHPHSPAATSGPLPSNVDTPTIRPYLIPRGDGSFILWDDRGQEVHSMVLDHSAQGGVASYPFKLHPGWWSLFHCLLNVCMVLCLAPPSYAE
jgi:hypothetical protein